MKLHSHHCRGLKPNSALLTNALLDICFSFYFCFWLCFCCCFYQLQACAEDLASQLKVTPAQPAREIALINGKITQPDFSFAQAILVKDNFINAVGTDQEIRSKVSKNAKIIDLEGATVIPGLIDSHIHAVRAGLTFDSEVSWIGVKTLPQALSRIKSKALSTPKSEWIIVAGGWSETQFQEQRKPTQAEIDRVAGGHPVYIQHFYDAILLSTTGIRALLSGAHSDSAKTRDLLSRLSAEDLQELNTGWLSGSSRAISDVYNLLPRPTRLQERQGTLHFFSELNSLGITGVMDPGGYNLPLSAYNTIEELDTKHQLTLRVRYSICAPQEDAELEDFKRIVITQQKKSESGFYKFNGLGENVVWSMYNNEHPTDHDKERLRNTLLWAAQQSLNVTLHWNNNDSFHHLLEVLESVNQVQPITQLRWSVAHVSDVTPQNLARMQALGVGWHVQNNFYYQGETFIQKRGLNASASIPRVQTAFQLGVRVSAGTDAHRVMSYNPFAALQWFLDGRTVAGFQMGSAQERPSREEALAMYTTYSAFDSFEENTRGQLAKGFLADLVVLDKDYFTVPIDQIGDLRSKLTIVDGVVVYNRLK